MRHGPSYDGQMWKKVFDDMVPCGNSQIHSIFISIILINSPIRLKTEKEFFFCFYIIERVL